jgi:hypothetical protein
MSLEIREGERFRMEPFAVGRQASLKGKRLDPYTALGEADAESFWFR